jgi:hypothetical protein
MNLDKPNDLSGRDTALVKKELGRALIGGRVERPADCHPLTKVHALLLITARLHDCRRFLVCNNLLMAS